MFQLSYPACPYTASLSRERAIEIWTMEDGAFEWLEEHHGGAMLLTAFGSTPFGQVELPLYYFDQETGLFYEDVLEILEGDQRFVVNGIYHYLEQIKWSFADEDAALLFKLTWGGA